MSRAVSEQLHLGQTSKGVQRPFLADLQQRWTIAGQQVCQPSVVPSSCSNSFMCGDINVKGLGACAMQQVLADCIAAHFTHTSLHVHMRPMLQ